MTETLSTAEKITAIEKSGWCLAYDGCHKIYLLPTPEHIASASDTGYTIVPASKIRETILGSCGLVFVNCWPLSRDDSWTNDWTIEQGTEDIYDAAEAAADAMTLLELIEEIERAHFRTESDLGANPAAMSLWNAVRTRAGLPRLSKSDLTTAAEYTDRSRDAISERAYPLMPR